MERCESDAIHGTPEDVQGGAIRSCASCGAGGGTEPASGGSGVRRLSGLGAEDAALLGSARVSAAAAGEAAEVGPWLGVIDAILEDDRQRSAKQRHTAKRIFDRLREEHGFKGGYTIVKDYVRMATLRGREMFVPLTHSAGEAQVDFGEALAVIAGVERKAHYLVMDLPHSDECFVVAFPAETTEAFLEGHVRAFAYFGGVPTRILSDNTKIAVAKILGGTERQRTRAFSELQRTAIDC